MGLATVLGPDEGDGRQGCWSLVSRPYGALGLPLG